MTKLVVVVYFFICLPVSAAPQIPDSDSLAASARRSHLRMTNIPAMANAADRATDIVRERASSAPNERYMATVVVNEGLQIQDLHGIVNRLRLDIVRIEIRVPLSSGMVRTISLGPMDLLASNGTVEQRLARSIGRVRYEFQEMARKLQGPDADKYTELAYAEMNIYKFEVVGAARQIEVMLGDNRVAAVFPEEAIEKGIAFDALKEDFRQKNPNAEWSATQPVRNDN